MKIHEKAREIHENHGKSMENHIKSKKILGIPRKAMKILLHDLLKTIKIDEKSMKIYKDS